MSSVTDEHRQRTRHLRWVFALWMIGFLNAPGRCFSAEPEFVGILATAISDANAREIGLSKTQREQLLEFIDQREIDALELALLPESERTVKLAAFRDESERLGLELLSDSQRRALESLRIAKLGMMSLGEPKVAQQLQLSQEQQSEVTRLLHERHEAIQNVGRKTATLKEEDYDRQLKAILSETQFAAWSEMAAKQVARPTSTKTQKQSTIPPVLLTDGGNSEQGMRFAFRYAPWRDVLEWFAAQADLSLVLDAPPQGTFNYTDPRDYTPAQAIDLINSVLLTKGYTLVRRDRMLMLINLEDGIPPNLVSEVAVNELDDRGEYELVRCLFTLASLKAEDAETEIEKLIGPQGNISVLSQSQQLLVTETAGRLRTIRKVLEASERRNQQSMGEATMVQLQHVRADRILTTWRQLMGISEEENSVADGSIRVAQGKSSRQLVITGQPHRIREFTELVQLLDVPMGGKFGIVDVPQLEVYPVTEADPESVLAVMETLLTGFDEVRLTTDPKTGNLVALARPAEHQTIRATLEQMQKDRRQVEVIRLRRVDPQLAVLSIEKLFGASSTGDEETDPTAPRVDAEPTTRSLLIRASESQISEIRALLEKMGETETELSDRSLASGRGNLRMIPIDAAAARRALDQLNLIWPAVRKNQIRSVTPSSSIRGFRSGAKKQPSSEPDDNDSTRSSTRPHQHRSVKTASDKVTSLQTKSRYVAGQSADALNGSEIKGDTTTSSEPADVIVTIGDQGLLVASEDLLALDEFEQIFRTVSDRMFTGSNELAVFYLKYAKAEVAADLIRQFISGGGQSSGTGTLLGNLAGAALGGGSGGGIIGSLLGVGGGEGGGSTISGNVSIIADPRLNALVVNAPPAKLDFVEQLLRVVDTDGSPETIETIPQPQLIPVLNTDADEIAKVIRTVYANRLAGGQGAPVKQPTPEDFIQAISGQKNTGRSIKDAIQDQVSMTVSVDSRRNALVIIAPDALFQEVKQLVAQLDFAMPEIRETIQYGEVTGSNPETIRGAMAALLSESTTREADRKENRPAVQNAAKPDESPPPSFDGDRIRRQLEFMKQIQRATQAKTKVDAKKSK